MPNEQSAPPQKSQEQQDQEQSQAKELELAKATSLRACRRQGYSDDTLSKIEKALG